MMESRKRPYLEDGDSSVAKKRALSSAIDSPMHVNGTTEGPLSEPRDEDDLELFQKGAIFRRMRYYSREHERSQRRITQLERNKSASEADTAALEACWTQLLDAINVLVNPEDIATPDPATQEALDLTSHTTPDAPTELVESLRNRMRVTQKLVATFVKLAGQNQPRSHDDLFKACQRAQSEATAVRSELKTVRAKLVDVEQQRSDLHDELLAAESRVDRLRSQSAPVAEKSQEKADGVKEEVIEDTKLRQLSPPAQAPPPVNGVQNYDSVEDTTWQDILNQRQANIITLEQENALLRDQVNYFKIELTQLSEDVVTKTPSYQHLVKHVSMLEHHKIEINNELMRFRDELIELKETRKVWEESVLASAMKEADELKALLKRRDDENSRLRQQRDQQGAEIVERKMKSSVKQAQLDEYKSLAEFRSERISILQTEVKRLRTRLAASNGDEDLLKFLLNDEGNTVAYVDDLKHRFADLDVKYQALHASLSKIQSREPEASTHIANEMDARQQLAFAQQRLAQYEKAYGLDLSTSSDSQHLPRLLETKEEELRVMRLKETQREQAEVALYAEMDKLSAAWEALDQQVKSKVFDLSAMEEKLTKHGLDRAKAENKFYSAMRDKEGIDTERKNVVRNLEKQAKVVENLSKSEKSLSTAVGTLEKEVMNLTKSLSIHRSRIDILESENSNCTMRLEDEKKRMIALREVTTAREKTFGEKNVELHRLHEELIKAKNEIERISTRLQSVGTNHDGSSTEKEIDLQNEVDKCMRLLKCSTCQSAMRSTVITKCMHSFCKSCVEARISHRQRKCPACNLTFSQSDVQTLFFQ